MKIIKNDSNMLAVFFSVFCCLILVQTYMYKVTKIEGLPSLKMYKYSVPFPFGWCMILEWMFPLLLCAGFVAAQKKHLETFYVIQSILVLGLLVVCCGEYGLKTYSHSRSHSVFFTCSKLSYWNTAHQKLGTVAPVYFAVWCGLACVLLRFVPFIFKWTRKQDCYKKYIKFIYIFCLCEGMVFNIIYAGQYTVWFIIRNLLLLLYLVYNEKGISEKSSNLNIEAIQNNKKEGTVWGCAVVQIIFAFHDVIYNYGIQKTGMEDVFSRITTEVPKLICLKYPLILITIVTIYVMKDKITLKLVSILATMCGSSFLVDYNLQSILYLSKEIMLRHKIQIISMEIYIVVGCIVLYVLFCWLCKRNKVTDTIFLTIVYTIVMVGTFWEKFVIEQEKLSFIVVADIVYLIMYIAALRKVHSNKVQCTAVTSKTTWITWFVITEYVIALYYDKISRWQSTSLFEGTFLYKDYGFSILNNLQDECENFMDFYWIPLCLMSVFLACLYGNKIMQLFFVVLSFATIFFLNFIKVYPIGEMGSYVGIPVCFLIELVVIFFYYLIQQENFKCNRFCEKIFFIITCGVIVYEFLVPFLQKKEEFIHSNNSYVIVPYGVMLIDLLIIFLIIFISYGKKYYNESYKSNSL